MIRWALLLLLPTLCVATERSPWTGDLFAFEARARYSFEHYERINAIPFEANNHYLNLGLVVTPWSSIDIEAQCDIAYTRSSDLFFEVGKLTARYVWLDDVAGDPLTATAAFTILGATHTSVLDPSTPETGEIGGEFQLALGKEWVRCGNWTWRNWVAGSAGLANKSSGWLRGQIATERHFCRCHTVWAALHGRIGLGNEPMPPLAQFTGYGPIAYRAIDLRASYEVEIGSCGFLSLSYLYRLYGRNFPEQLQRISLQILFPFSL